MGQGEQTAASLPEIAVRVARIASRMRRITAMQQAKTLSGLLALLIFTSCSAAIAPPLARAAEPPLIERCVANGLGDFQEATGATFNHHPEKQREFRGTDRFLTSLETDISFQGVIADLPGYCQGSFHREGSIKLLFKTTKRGWRPIVRSWQPLAWETPTLYERTNRRPEPEDSFDEEPEEGEPRYAEGGEIRYATGSSYRDGGKPSPWARTEIHQNTNTLGLGCTIASRARVKLLIVDDRTSAIVAARLYTLPIQVESWYLARCLRKFSLESQARARSCPGSAVAGGPSTWRIKAKRVGCRTARAVGQRALQLPAFAEGMTAARRVGGWRCYYALRGAASCKRGRRHIYAQLRGGAGDKCDRSASPTGVKSLKVLGTPCSTGAALASAILAEPGSPSPVGKEIDGIGWTCASKQFFEYEDLLAHTYNCFSGRAVVYFRFAKPRQRLVPAERTSAAAGVLFPGQGHEELFTITPALTFSEHVKWTKSKILLPLTADAALAGRKAHVKVEVLKAKCEWTSDAGQTSPICPSTWRVGAARRRSLVLAKSQTINVGKPKRRGNWIYRLTVATPAFSLNSLDYRKTSHTLSFWMINAAAHCERNPWCHPHKK